MDVVLSELKFEQFRSYLLNLALRYENLDYRFGDVTFLCNDDKRITVIDSVQSSRLYEYICHLMENIDDVTSIIEMYKNVR